MRAAVRLTFHAFFDEKINHIATQVGLGINHLDTRQVRNGQAL
jgi:hypothetical protein